MKLRTQFLCHDWLYDWSLFSSAMTSYYAVVHKAPYWIKKQYPKYHNVEARIARIHRGPFVRKAY